MVKGDDRETAFMPAIAALRSELADLERRAAHNRQLIEALCERAGLADDPPRQDAATKPTPTRTATVATRAPHARRRRASRASRPGAVKPTTAPAKPGNGVDELAKIVAEIAETAHLVAAATRAKDAKQLRAAIATRAQAERCGGALLIAMAGKKPLPGVSKIESRRWRRVASLVPDEFEARIERATRKALAAISIGAHPNEKAPKRRNKTSLAAMPRPKMELTPWRAEPDGSLSRTLTAVDGAGAEAT